MNPRHFLTLTDCTAEELHALIRRGIELKRMRRDGLVHEPLKNRVLSMIFEKASTRTRVSFEAGMVQLGGHAMFLSPRDTQLGRGETIEDTARVISSMVDAIMIRTFGHETLTRFAEYSRVPIINGLSDEFHPCQLLADMQTYWEHRDDIRGRTVVWVGDGNNMCRSYVNAARMLDFQLRVCCPPGYAPGPQWLADPRIEFIPEPSEALRGAHLVVTDVWASMGQEREREQRLRDLAPYRITDGLMELADPQALFMHCLPAHRGEEVEAEVIDGAQSVVWDEAENRLHAQKALLEFLLLNGDHR
ncbi:ornithine carbamoyltransferase [Nitrococcus mobilis]|uniref:Ornithine carbamoyltransferase n=1 Tax=Nitrococcus mobilis Nb-231 TaxID=314278 RepID=A4BSW7_9GAMM|nr:ornithine carbamoyltransferase [Nitrococcus mobilis]EAR21211.1 ornithine carbamoyltransferase [Nitrococcus mobilis Nb-231]